MSIRKSFPAAIAAVSLLCSAAIAQQRPIHPIGPHQGFGGSAQAMAGKVVSGTIVVPESSRVKVGDAGKVYHTNVRFVAPASMSPLETPPYGGYLYETPASLGCIYALLSAWAGCNPNTAPVSAIISGGGQSIAIVDAFDDPEAQGDLAYFSALFGIPFNPAKFKVVWADGVQPDIDYSGGWEMEEALDIEYAHAMAPDAMLYLVEASTNSDIDLGNAVTVAVNLVRCGLTTTCPGSPTGKGEISMSWGAPEFAGETSEDATFVGGNVVFLAASGDDVGTSYPAASPNVIAVGGTGFSRSLATGSRQNTIPWEIAGSGVSLYEPHPAFQTPAVASGNRVIPDVAAVADPVSGVWVYDSFPMDGYWYPNNWWIVGGTSVATPVWAGIINNAGQRTGFAASTNAELVKLYNTLPTPATYAATFKDVTYGYCGPYINAQAAAGFDRCTGLGSPGTYANK